MSLLTSHSTMGDYSLVYRGGISYLIGVIIYVMKMNKKYVTNVDGVMSYDRMKNNGRDESKIKYNCCSTRIIIALLIICLIILSGTGTNFTFGNWNKQFKKWYDERDDKYIAVLKLLYFRTFFTIAVGVIFKYFLDVEGSILSNKSSSNTRDRITMHSRNNDTSIDVYDEDNKMNADNSTKLGTELKKSLYGKVVTLALWKMISRLSYSGFIFGHFLIVVVVSIFGDIEYIKNTDIVRIYSIYIASLILSSMLILVMSVFIYTYFERPLLTQKRMLVFE